MVLDGLTRLLVNVTNEWVTLLGCPGLLVTRLPPVVVWERRRRTHLLGVVNLQHLIPASGYPTTAQAIIIYYSNYFESVI